MLRKIKAHKGNRSKMLPVRLTPEIHAWITSKEESAADWITRKAQAEINALKAEFQQYEGVEIEASDNGATFDLAWALLLLKQYGLETPQDQMLSPLSVTWLAGLDAALSWQQYKDDGWRPLRNWTDEKPFIDWTA